MTFAQYCRSQSRNSLLALAIFGVLVIGYLDFLTGYEVSLFLFYAGPILFAVWYLDRESTILVVLFSAIVWWWADLKSGHAYFASWVQIWETVARLIFFSFIAIGGGAIKSRHESMKAWVANINRIRELEREILAAGEREQQRIGADLQDGLCQYLAGLTCFTGSLRDRLADRCRPEAQLAAELHDLLRDAIIQARNIAQGITPAHLDRTALTAALREAPTPPSPQYHPPSPPAAHAVPPLRT